MFFMACRPPPLWPENLSQSAINKWDVTFQSRHLPSLASNHQVLFVKSCTSRQSSIIHLTCVSPCLGSQLWSPAAAGACGAHHSPLVPVHSLLSSHCITRSCKWEPFADASGKDFGPGFLSKIFPAYCVFSDLVGAKKKKLLLRDTVPLGPLTPHLLWQRSCYKRRMPEP